MQQANIDIARDELKLLHPLKGVKIKELFPVIRRLSALFKPKNPQLIPKEFVKSNEATMPSSIKRGNGEIVEVVDCVIDNSSENSSRLDFTLNEGEDPVKRVGNGVRNYFKMVTKMVKLMFWMSVLNVPLLYLYG
jgi:hypothetical protein